MDLAGVAVCHVGLAGAVACSVAYASPLLSRIKDQMVMHMIYLYPLAVYIKEQDNDVARSAYFFFLSVGGHLPDLLMMVRTFGQGCDDIYDH